MPDAVARRSRRGPATAETVDAVHDDLDSLWRDAEHVPAADRAAFTLAVLEVAANVVLHAVPAPAAEGLELRVDVSAGAGRLAATVQEVGAAPADVDLSAAAAPDPHAQSGRGLELVRGLVDELTLTRRTGTNVWQLCRLCR